MNKKFVLFDKINGIQREATYILTFESNNSEFLIYYLDEDNNNKQIFVSKLIKNTEGKYFISDINSNDKNRINTIVYNIVIVLPSESSKSSNKDIIINEFKNKYNIDISLRAINIETQNYLHSSRVAITSDKLVNNCIDFYNIALNTKQIENNYDEEKIIPQINSENNLNTDDDQLPNINPQMQILKKTDNNSLTQTFVTHDNSIVTYNKKEDKSNEGFVINASIIIGTIAILLAVIIVTFTFITIKKMII